MGFDSIFRNRLTRPTIRPMLTTGGAPTEKAIVWSADTSGLLARIEALEAKVDQLSSALSAREARASSDLDPDPNVDVVTGYEYASDGTLRAYVEVTVEDRRVYEVALLGTHTYTYAIKDATVDEANPDSSFGEDPFIEVSAGTAGSKRVWLQFDWGNYPDGLWAAKPILAVLRLVKSQPSSGEVTLCLGYEDLGGTDWNESTITWNNQPNIGGIVSRVPDNAGNYTFIDLTGLFYMFWEAKQADQDFVPYGLVVLAQGDGSVSWISSEGATIDNEKPQLRVWEKAEKSQLIGGTVRTAKFYGRPGGGYYLVHRRLDENNNPGRWSAPIYILLPSTGAIPPAPADPPLVMETNISNLLEIILSDSVPPDFSAYEVEILYYEGETDEEPTTELIKVRSDRFSHSFSSGTYVRTYRLRYRFVTRSGACSDWSPYTPPIPIYNQVYLAPPGGYEHGGISIGPGGYIFLDRPNDSPGKTLDYVGGSAYPILHDKDKDVKYNNIQSCSDEVHYYGVQSTTSTDWVTLTDASITLTPPGSSGDAYMLLMAWITGWKDQADCVRFTFKVDGVVSSNEEGYSASGTAETVTIIHRAKVTAGQPHTFELCYKSGNGGQVTVYRYKFIITHIGNV